jgi:hypothetical protein
MPSPAGRNVKAISRTCPYQPSIPFPFPLSLETYETRKWQFPQQEVRRFLVFPDLLKRAGTRLKPVLSLIMRKRVSCYIRLNISIPFISSLPFPNPLELFRARVSISRGQLTFNRTPSADSLPLPVATRTKSLSRLLGTHIDRYALSAWSSSLARGAGCRCFA